MGRMEIRLHEETPIGTHPGLRMVGDDGVTEPWTERVEGLCRFTLTSLFLNERGSAMSLAMVAVALREYADLPWYVVASRDIASVGAALASRGFAVGTNGRRTVGVSGADIMEVVPRWGPRFVGASGVMDGLLLVGPRQASDALAIMLQDRWGAPLASGIGTEFGGVSPQACEALANAGAAAVMLVRDIEQRVYGTVLIAPMAWKLNISAAEDVDLRRVDTHELWSWPPDFSLPEAGSSPG